MRDSEFLRGSELLSIGAHSHYLPNFRDMDHIDCASSQPQYFLSWLLWNELLTVLTLLAPIPYDQDFFLFLRTICRFRDPENANTMQWKKKWRLQEGIGSHKQAESKMGEQFVVCVSTHAGGSTWEEATVVKSVQDSN